MLNGGTLEHAQQIAAHQSPRTTKLYDRTKDEISLDEVERIKFWSNALTIMASVSAANSLHGVSLAEKLGGPGCEPGPPTSQNTVASALAAVG